MAVGVGVSVVCMMSTAESAGRLAAYVQWMAGWVAEERTVETLADYWWYAGPGGVPMVKCIETTRKPDETEEAFEARHEARVAKQEAKCPPIDPPPSSSFPIRGSK